ARFVTRGLWDGTLKFEPDDVVKIKVIPVYIGMMYNRGRDLAVIRRHEEAIQAYQQALAYEPSFAAAQKSLSESQSALRKSRAPTTPCCVSLRERPKKSLTDSFLEYIVTALEAL